MMIKDLPVGVLAFTTEQACVDAIPANDTMDSQCYMSAETYSPRMLSPYELKILEVFPVSEYDIQRGKETIVMSKALIDSIIFDDLRSLYNPENNYDGIESLQVGIGHNRFEALKDYVNRNFMGHA